MDVTALARLILTLTILQSHARPWWGPRSVITLSQNVSRFEPQEGRPEGDRHEDWTIFSYDRNRETFVVRQFNSEGFVNRFVLDPSSVIPTKMIFVSEASENAPPGLRARLTYEKLTDDELRKTFELAMPGEDFDVLIRNHWTRADP